MGRQIINLFGLVLFLTCLTFSHSTFHIHAESYVQEACNVTRYQNLCLKTLASYSNKARESPSRWARAGVSVTIGHVKMVAQYLNNLNRHGYVIGSRNRAALSDCVENIQDTLDNLHKSLDVLRRFSRGEFDGEVNDVLTWLSAALTDQDTCIDGFEGKRGNEIDKLCNKVRISSFITSNALALANKLATSGLQDSRNDP